MIDSSGGGDGRVVFSCCLLLVLAFALFGCETAGATDFLGDRRRAWGVSTHASLGAVLFHSPKLMPLREGVPHELSVGLYAASDPSSDVGRFWGNPRFGVAFQYMGLGSPRRLGNAHALYSSVTFFPLRYGGWSLEVDVAAGLALTLGAYDAVDNPYNSAVGSVLNAFLSMGVGGGVDVGHGGRVSVGGRYSHISNGTVVRPNMGLNYFLLALGYRQEVGVLPSGGASDVVVQEEGFRSAHALRLQLGGGVKREGAPLGPIFWKGVGTVQYVFSPLRYVGYFAAVDYGVMGGQRILTADSLYVSVLPWRFPYVSAYGGVEISLGRVNASLGVGAYLTKPSGDPALLCERLRLSFALTDRLRALVGIMAHAFQADLLELGLQFDAFTWGRRSD